MNWETLFEKYEIRSMIGCEKPKYRDADSPSPLPTPFVNATLCCLARTYFHSNLILHNASDRAVLRKYAK